MTDKCANCKDKIPGNTRFVLMQMTMVGYQTFNFCCLKCYLDYVFKKYKKKFARNYL